MAATRFPGTVTVQPDGKNGLTVPSVALVFQLGALDNRSFVARLGDASMAKISQVIAQLTF